MNENTQYTILTIVGLSSLSIVYGWIVTWKNTANMSQDSKIRTYYENNLYASIAIAVAIVLNLLMNVSKLDPMYMFIPGLIVLSGYSTLWSNTAKMESDPNANKYYKGNKKASLLIGIPYAIMILTLIWFVFINQETGYKKEWY
jgi:hypothetical protein